MRQPFLQRWGLPRARPRADYGRSKTFSQPRLWLQAPSNFAGSLLQVGKSDYEKAMRTVLTGKMSGGGFCEGNGSHENRLPNGEAGRLATQSLSFHMHGLMKNAGGKSTLQMHLCRVLLGKGEMLLALRSAHLSCCQAGLC